MNALVSILPMADGGFALVARRTMTKMYLNKKQLTERGWSPTLIKKFLGEPDDVQPLGKYAEEHRYFLPRIENVENLEDFKTAQEKYLARRSSGKQSARTQTQKRIESARTMIIRVRRLPEDEVLEAAIDHYNFNRRGRRWDDDGWTSPATRDSDQSFLVRITVNYIRHQLTSYDYHLFIQRGRIGGDEAAQIIRRRVFLEIAAAYPQLEDECDQQMLSRGLITQTEIENKKKSEYEQLELPF
jgi:hypothetical protein